MVIIVLAVLLGILLGLFMPVPSNQVLSLYFVVGIFAALDSVLGAIRSSLEDEYDSKIFISGFLTNTIISMILAYVGDKLSLPLYYAAIFVFGIRLFSNISIIRRIIIHSNDKGKRTKSNQKHDKKSKNRRYIYYTSLRKRKK